MKDAMHLPSRREVEVVSIRRDNLRDLKGVFLSKGQFSGRKVDFQVMRVKPDLCFYFPGAELHSNPFFYYLSCFSMGSGSLFASSIKDFELFVESREECLFNWGIGLGLEAHHEREWHLVGDGVGGRVMRKLGHGRRSAHFVD